MPFTTRLPKRFNRTTIPLLASLTAVVVMVVVLTSAVLPKQPLRVISEQKSSYARANKGIPKCSKQGRAQSFLIVFQSRSGSTAISTHLKTHSNVHMTLLEYLDRSGVSRANTTGALAATRAFFEEGIKKGLVPGFKIRSNHILGDAENWSKLTREFNTRIIWQYRKNVIKSAIGTYQSEVLGDSTAISGIKTRDMAQDRCSMGVGCKFKIAKMDVFHEILKNRVHYQDAISEAVNILDGGRSCTLEVPYEDYLYFPNETVMDMLAFLGLRYEDTSTDRIKATADSLCDVVDNFDELCYNFYGCTGWQPYFDDFVNDCRCSNFSSGSVKYCQVTS